MGNRDIVIVITAGGVKYSYFLEGKYYNSLTDALEFMMRVHTSEFEKVFLSANFPEEIKMMEITNIEIIENASIVDRHEKF